MPSQTSSNVLVAIQRELSATPGVAAVDGAGSADQLRITGSPGLTGKMGVIQSEEKRDDGDKTMGRLGNRSVDGSYNAELSVGGDTDILLEAIMRSTWGAAAVRTYDNSAELTSLEITGTAEITQVGTTSFIGVIFVGDTIRLDLMSTVANNDLNLRVVTVAANVLTVAGTPLTVQAADIACTMTRLKKVSSATTPTRYSHTIEQYDQDTDLSQLFLGNRLTGLRLQGRPNAHVQVTYTFLGMDWTDLEVGTSPYFTTPALSTTLGLIMDDAAILYNGSAIATLTGFDLNFDIAAQVQPVIGARVSPDVFDNDRTVSGQITGIRSDFSNPILFRAETEFELMLLLQEPGTAPLNCYSIFLPRVKISGLSAPVGGGDGAKVETLDLMVGVKAAAAGYDGTIATICSSAAA